MTNKYVTAVTPSGKPIAHLRQQHSVGSATKGREAPAQGVDPRTVSGDNPRPSVWIAANGEIEGRVWSGGWLHRATVHARPGVRVPRIQLANPNHGPSQICTSVCECGRRKLAVVKECAMFSAN